MLLSALDSAFPVPDRPTAVTIGDTEMSRAQLREAADAIGLTLPNDAIIAVNAQPTIDTVAAIAACLLTERPVIPIPPDSGTAEITHYLTDSGATHWLGPTPSIDITEILDVNRRSGAKSRIHHDTALIAYTSGTTGAPKGVELSAQALAAGLDAVAEAWEWTAADTVVHGLPLFHLHGLVLGVLGSLRIGSRIVHTRPKSTDYAAARGTMYFGVPTIWSRIANDPASAQSLREARLLVSGSAPLPVQVHDRIVELTGQAPLERYGMTETLITLSSRPADRRRGWVGSALPGTEVRLRSEDGNDVPADGVTVGQLEVRSPSMFTGYLHRDDATRSSFTSDGWFKTGDLAVVDSSGFHRIVGRASTDLIKSGGYKIGAGEIESALLDHPAVREAAVVAVPDADLGERPVAWIVATDSHQDSTDQLETILIDYVGDTLSRHKRPREIRVVNQLPRNAMGKIQKSLIVEQMVAASSNPPA